MYNSLSQCHWNIKVFVLKYKVTRKIWSDFTSDEYRTTHFMLCKLLLSENDIPGVAAYWHFSSNITNIYIFKSLILQVFVR